MDISGVFIGREALAAGTLSRYELRKYYRAVMPDVYAGTRSALTLRQRTMAAWLWSGREAVIAGAAASALHGAEWVADDAPIELIWPNARAPRQVITRQDLLLDGEVLVLDDMTVTTAHRTAFDLGRRGRIGEAVARLDALIRATGLAPADVRALADRHRHTRGLRQLERAIELADGGAQSPKETWLRLMLIEDGFPRPRTQIPILDPAGHPKYYLDMGWEDRKLAVEYDGVQHADALAYDIERHDYIAGLGWTVVRVAAGQRRPGIIARVEREWRRLSALTLR
ncbi:endonuclease domain-containing protein [Mycolicibacterium sp. A43C]